MANANLSITINERRMLKQSEAAIYAGLAAKHFKATCPVRPVEIRPGSLLWDKHDLDKWIDNMKEGVASVSRQDILGKL